MFSLDGLKSVDLSPRLKARGWETKMDAPEPENCPTPRATTGNNIPIAYPLANIESLTQDRVFFMILPLNVEPIESTWVRAIAIEDI